MALIRCKCGASEKNFRYLNNGDMPEGWLCPKCPEKSGKKEVKKVEPAEEVRVEVVEEPKVEAPKDEVVDDKEEQPKRSRSKNGKKRKTK